MKKRTDYPALPFIQYGKIIDRNGFYITLPFKGISLNEFKKMHFGNVARIKGQYKSVLDVVCVDCIDKKYFKFVNFDGDGIKITKNLFNTQIDIEWVLTFLTVNQRDTANYTQKTLLDAIVKVGLIPDDREKFVKSDKTFFGMKKMDTITCIMQSDDMDHSMIVGGKDRKYQELMDELEVSSIRHQILVEDDGGYDE